MATTDARTGFRLPWSTDQRPQDDERAEAVAADEQTDEEARAMHATETSTHEPLDAAAGTSTGTAADETTAGEGVGEVIASAEETVVADVGQESAEHDGAGAPSGSQAGPSGASASGRRPTKFMADLTKAMQAAAQAARDETVERLQAEAKSFVEKIHARSSEDSADLRRRADEDVAAVRDWSKAEIARIREETEQRITDRKSHLEREIEEHAALIERQIERIQGRVGSFEQEMERFFERLLAEEDPTRIAAMAENLPEPPAFDPDDVLAEAASWSSTGDEPAATESAGDDLAGDDLAGDDLAGNDPATEDVATAAEPPVEAVAATEAAEPEASEATIAEVADPWNGLSWDAPSPGDQEAAFAAIQAAAEAAEMADRDLQAVDAEALAPTEPVGQTDPSDGAAEWAAAGGYVDAPVDEPATADGQGETTDPRLAALGLAPEFAAAAEAEAEAAATVDEIPTIDDAALAARIAGLVPDGAVADEAQTTHVTVVGLISVASIAGFKRHLGRIAGVRSVGVSSGPEGEFIFTVSHGPEVVLTDAIPTLPGFGARVASSDAGSISVTARDPEADA